MDSMVDCLVVMFDSDCSGFQEVVLSQGLVYLLLRLRPLLIPRQLQGLGLGYQTDHIHAEEVIVVQ
jgi:hypothetical protein